MHEIKIIMHKINEIKIIFFFSSVTISRIENTCAWRRKNRLYNVFTTEWIIVYKNSYTSKDLDESWKWKLSYCILTVPIAVH